MPNALDDSLRPHLSALVDGELEPLEAIALQRHLRSKPALGDEYRELEQLKLQVHLAGRRDEPDAGLERRLLSRLHAEARAAEVRRARRRWVTPVAAVAAVATAAVALLIALPLTSGGGDRPAPAAVAGYDLADSALARLISVHTGALPPMALRDMELSGALLTMETLPGGFIARDGAGASGIVQASYEACSEREAGATMAVLRADHIALPAGTQAALESAGVFEDEIDGVSVKLSLRGDKLFVLLDDKGGLSTDPI
ncbi:MAG: hypothetical protein CSA66_00815 [Proteobacteria bacterium]|nr:MAG: hypothetical protein CSA66_00815 [Pseudomonadota bacterium]